MNKTQEPIFVDGGQDTPRPDLPFIERQAISAIVYNPKTGKYLGLRWKKIDWETFITGGIEEGQTAEEAARAEVHEETGYKNLQLAKELPRYQAQFYHGPKGVNRHAFFSNFLFELIDDEKDEIDEDEQAKHECVWLNEAELKEFNLPTGHKFLFESLSN